MWLIKSPRPDKVSHFSNPHPLNRLKIDLQRFLRSQPNKNSYDLVCDTLKFLDCICGSTTGGLGLLGLYINEGNVELVNQTLESLTEYCQGPCHENQVCLVPLLAGGRYFAHLIIRCYLMI